MKLIFQIAAGVLLAMLVHWTFIEILVPAYMLARLESGQQQTASPPYVPSYDKEYPCAHMELGSSVREWCEANQANRAADAAHDIQPAN